MREEGRVNQSEFKPRKPYDQLSKSGKKLRRLRERDPERYEKVNRSQRERYHKRMCTVPGYRERLRNQQRKYRKAHPEVVEKSKETQKVRYHRLIKSDPEYKEKHRRDRREWWHNQKTKNPKKYQRMVKSCGKWKSLRLRVMRRVLIKRRGDACERCGFNDIRILDLHHLNNDASEIRSHDLPKMFKGEIPYEVLCANCHRIHHYEEPEPVDLTLLQVKCLKKLAGEHQDLVNETVKLKDLKRYEELEKRLKERGSPSWGFQVKKPYEQLSHQGKWICKVMAQDPERYKEIRRRNNERGRERRRRLKEEDPQGDLLDRRNVEYRERLQRLREMDPELFKV